MKLILLVFGAVLALLVGATVAPIFVSDPGRVVLLFHGWRIETTVLGMALFALFAAAAVWLTWWLLRLPLRARYRWQHRHDKRAWWPAGVKALLEGRHDDAERLLAGKGPHGDERAAGYLLAASAAANSPRQDADALDRRQRYLERALEESPSARIAVLMDQARRALRQDQPELALQRLDAIPESQHHHAGALALRLDALWQLGRADELPVLQSRVRKQLGKPVAEQWRRRYLLHRLSHLPDAEAIDELWREVPRKWRKESEFAQAYAIACSAAGRSRDAVRIALMSLREHWDEPLIRSLGELPLKEPAHALKRIEPMLVQHPDSPGLLATLGRLCVSLELTGQARVYLRDSLRLEDDAPTCQALADLLEQEGDLRDALAYWRRLAKLPAGERRTPVLHVEPLAPPSEDEQR
jgi:HemY protein